MLRRGIDTNVLVRATVPSLPNHAATRLFLEQQLKQPEVTLVLTPGILHEFVHVITDPRRFDPPVGMVEALAVARSYLGRSNVECLAVGEPALLVALDLLQLHRLGRKRIADTLFAASLIEAGVRELITTNQRDFEIFDQLRLISPLEEP